MSKDKTIPNPTPRWVNDDQPLEVNAEQNLSMLLRHLGEPTDLVVRRIPGDGDQNFVILCYLESLVDDRAMGSLVIDPLFGLGFSGQAFSYEQIKRRLNVGHLEEYPRLHAVIDSFLAGQVILFVDGADQAMALSIPGFVKRAVEEPITEKAIRGPREGLTEVLNDNLGMVRRWLKDPNLRAESLTIGERTKTNIALMYLQDVANPDIVQEARKRLEAINIDGIVDSGYITHIIADNRLTVFPLVQETERPDKVTAALLEGRVAILVDKTPFALLVPVTSNEFYQTPQDFYYNYWVGTFLRFLRGIGTFISVTLPGLYVTIVSVNHTLVPGGLVQVLASARTQMPFPAVIETIGSLIVFEIFREAVVRVPGNVSTILGIAGGVLLGQMGVSSGLVAGSTVIIVIISTLSSFCTANTSKEQAWRIIRYFLLIGSGFFGLFGLTLAGVLVLAHMASLKSFGISYLAPWAPPLPVDIIEAYFVNPWWLNYRRPPTYRPQQEDRLGTTKSEDKD